jgi:hypothetical protein
MDQRDENWPDALARLERALELFRLLGDLRGELRVLLSLGQTFAAAEDWLTLRILLNERWSLGDGRAIATGKRRLS